MTTTRTGSRLERLRVVAIASGFHGALVLWMLWGLDFDFMTSDPAIYWDWSLELTSQRFHDWWVPGYPIVLALLRGITLGALSPTATMLLACYVFYIVGTWATYRFASVLGSDYPSRMALLYAVFPFVGLTYSVHPVADSMALATMMLACDNYARRQYCRFSLWTAIALLTHKASWLLFGPLALMTFVLRPKRAKWALLAGVPVTVYLALGAAQTGDGLWFLRHSQRHLFASESQLPILDSVFGTLLGQGSKGVIKGTILLLVFAGGLLVLVQAIRDRDPLSSALGAFVVLLGLSLNQYEALALLRFAKILVVQVALLPSMSTASLFVQDRFRGGLPFWLIVLLFFGTNVASSVYLARYLS